MKKYTQIKGNQYLVSDVYYRKGEGYYVSVFPVKVEKREGYSVETFLAYSGYKRLIVPAKRASEKMYQKALAEAAPFIPTMMTKIVNQMRQDDPNIGITGMRKISSIQIVAKRFIHPSGLNPFGTHRVRVYVNGIEVVTGPLRQGERDEYESYTDSAKEELEDLGLIKDIKTNETLHSYCKRKGIDLSVSAKDFKTISPLKNF